MMTANSAFTKGYEVFIIEDCCGDTSKKDHYNILDIYNKYHIKVVNSENLIKN